MNILVLQFVENIIFDFILIFEFELGLDQSAV